MGETSGRERRRREHECRRDELPGGPGGRAHHGKFLKLDSLKRHFLRSLSLGSTLL